MDNKISLTAAVMAGLGLTPFSAQAQEEPKPLPEEIKPLPEQIQEDVGAYGRINVGIQHVNDDGVGPYGQDEGLGLMDVDSRFGFRGEHDLNDSLTALYTFEFAVDATEADIENNDRLSWLGLEGDFGRIKAGRMWSAWYTYLGWNTDRSQFWGGTGYYGYPAFSFNGGMPTTRVSDTVQYTYGGGGYTSQPFTFTAEVAMDGQSTPNAPSADSDPGEDPQDVDLVTLAAMGTMGPVQVNGAIRQQSSNDPTAPADPSQAGLGVRWQNGPLYLGGSYIRTDLDDGSSSENPAMVEVLGTYDLGDGLSTQLSVSQLDNDTSDGQGDTTGVFAQVNKDLTEQLNAYVEGQALSVDGGSGSPDTSPQVILVGMGYSFP
jgi:predicted porin